VILAVVLLLQLLTQPVFFISASKDHRNVHTTLAMSGIFSKMNAGIARVSGQCLHENYPQMF